MEEVEDSKVNRSPSDLSPQESLPFVEVICTASGKTRRFSIGTEAGFALNLMNKKLEKEGILGTPLASHIQAVKEGEEPVSFGPNSILVNYGPGWKLQTVNDIDGVVKVVHNGISFRRAYDKGADDSHSMKKKSQSQSHSAISFLYIAKILLAFIFLFIFGAIFTLVLENLPQLILYINSSV